MSTLTLEALTTGNGFISDGDWIEAKDQDQNGGIRLIQLADIGDRQFLNKSQRYVNENTVRHLNCTLLRDGDVLIARMPDPLGRACVFPKLKQPAITAVDICIVRSNPELVDPDWLSFTLNTPQVRKEIQNHAQGATRLRVPTGKLKQLELDCPPLTKQRQIATRLKAQLAEVEKARQAAQAQLNGISHALNQIIEAQIVHALSTGGNLVKLQDVSTITAKLVNPEQQKFCELPHVSAENVESLTGKLLNIRSAKEDGMTSGKYLFDAGDILYSKLRPYLRKVARPDFDGLCSADMYPIKTDTAVLNMDFLKILLTSNLFTDYANEKSARSRMPKLNREQLFEFEFTLPKLASQEKCVRMVNSVLLLSEQASTAATSILKDIGLLPQRILTQAFNQ